MRVGSIYGHNLVPHVLTPTGLVVAPNELSGIVRCSNLEFNICPGLKLMAAAIQ